MERTFAAPPAAVWRAMTDPDAIVRWWGPPGTTTSVEVMDVRPGGAWRWISHIPGEADWPSSGEYREVVPRARLVYTIDGGDGEPFVVAVDFAEEGAGTRLTSRTRFPSPEMLAGMLEGMAPGMIETWDRLARDLATDG